MSRSPSRPVAVSAPGKVLFAGGFLVLDRAHTGLVFGLNARIHVHVQSWSGDRLDQTRATGGPSGEQTYILVESPQFLDARWLYAVNSASENEDAEDSAIGLEQVHGESVSTGANKFVETTLRYVLTFLSHLSRSRPTDLEGGNVKVTILADDDYYSQPRSRLRSQSQTTGASLLSANAGAAAPAERFTKFGVRLSEAHKTGLGSSAALVTALVAALLAFYTQPGETEGSSVNDRRVHNLAQAAHCAAQGKVGSGFDVAAAVYGSCLYRRFTPSILENVGDPARAGFGERLHRCVEDLDLGEGKWDVEVLRQAVQIPDSLVLVMCDVDCGSETPGMVRKVLSWRKDNPEEAALLWNALQAGQEDLCRELKRLSEVDGIDEPAPKAFTGLGDDILAVRSLVREMSVKSGVPIEPPVITELLDHCTSLSGVVGGVAPGAGGYDAVALLVHNTPDAVNELQARLEGWQSPREETTGATIGHVKLLGVKQEKEGVRVEQTTAYVGWV